MIDSRNLARRLGVAICVTLGAAGASSLRAQDYPARPIKIIVPFSPGGAVDGPTRIVAQELSKRLGQQIVVENNPAQGPR